MSQNIFSFFQYGRWSRLLNYTGNGGQHLLKVTFTALATAFFEMVAMIFMVLFLSEISTSASSVTKQVEWIKAKISFFSDMYLNGDFLLLNVLLIIFTLVAREIFSFLNIYFNRIGMSQVELNLRSKLLESVMLSDYQAADKIGSGPFVEMAGLASKESAKLLQVGTQALKLFFVIFSYFAVLFYSFPMLGVLGVIIGAFVIFALNFTLKHVKNYSSSLTNQGFEFSQRAERAYSLRRSLKIDQLVKLELLDTYKHACRLYDLANKIELVSSVTRSLVSIFLFVVLFLSVYFLLKVQFIDIVLLSSGILVMMRLTPLLVGSARLRTGVAMKMPLFDAIDKTIESLVSFPEADLGTKLVSKKPSKFHVKNLSYKYPDVTDSVLYDLNFTLNSGETVALVGPSGAGKTTLVNVLVRLLTPSSGDVFLDNQNINELQLDDYRSHFCYTGQNPAVFDETILHNLTIRSQNYQYDELKDLLRETNLDGFVNKLPDGLNTVIGERGLKLSGGQQQRIGLVSAFMKKANICIFDEPTSALDVNNQSQIVKLIKNHTSNRNTITVVISHNWNMIKDFDRMIILDGGRIVYDDKPIHKKFFEI
jgi:ATP-binding cassette, subfamily B, bacterial MsbA